MRRDGERVVMRAYGDCNDGGSCRSTVVPAVKRPVQDDNVAWMQDHLAVVELESDCAVQDDVEVRRGCCVHPRPS
jgi:hypothetical protein